MQEDFFLYGRVDDNAISKYAQLLISNNIQCLHITPYLNGSAGPSCFDNIDIIKQNYEYRIDCQAAFWDKEVMMSYLDLRETAWEFEKLGSKRASWTHHTFLKVRKSYVQNNPILPYYSTGINKSRWQGGVTKVFEDNGIVIDYSVRGFYENLPKEDIVTYLRNRIKKVPSYLRQIPVLMKLAVKYYIR